MEILEDEHRGGGGLEFPNQSAGDVVRPVPALDPLVELPAGRAGDVEQWSQRTRGEQRVACRPQDPRAGGEIAAEALKERCLPNSRFTLDQENASSRIALDGRQRLTER